MAEPKKKASKNQGALVMGQTAYLHMQASSSTNWKVSGAMIEEEAQYFSSSDDDEEEEDIESNAHQYKWIIIVLLNIAENHNS